jgi:pimeloyl-ACP methyl ester carboxylesterase
MNAKHLSALVLTLLFALPAIAIAGEEHHDCGSDTQGSTSFQFCIDTPAKPSGDILWYFHGAFGSEQFWHDDPTTSNIRRVWEANGQAEPTTISISLGKYWIMTEENKVYPDFVSQILPALEAKAGGLHGRRLLMGFSLGGFNAAQLVFHNGTLFQRVVLASPAFITVGPYSTQEEVNGYFERNNISFTGHFKVNAYLELLGENYATQEIWMANDPLELGKNGLPPGTNLYLSAADGDDYGFHEGCSQFAQVAPARGAAVQWDSLHGEHKTINVAAVAAFLALTP